MRAMGDRSAANRRSVDEWSLLHIAASMIVSPFFDLSLRFAPEVFQKAVARYAIATRRTHEDAELWIVGKAIALRGACREKPGVADIICGEMRRAREALDAGQPLPRDLFR